MAKFVGQKLPQRGSEARNSDETMSLVQRESRHLHARAPVGALQGVLSKVVLAHDGAHHQGVADDRA